MARFCTKCGATVEDRAVVCPQCGTRLSAAPGADPNRTAPYYAAPQGAPQSAPQGAPQSAPKSAAQSVKNVTSSISDGFSKAVDSIKNGGDSKKTLIVIIAAVVALALVICVGCVVANYTGVNGVANKIMKVYKAGDADKFGDMLAEMTVSAYFKDEDNRDDEALAKLYEEKLKSEIAGFDEGLDGDYKITYKIIAKTKLSDKTVDALFSENKEDQKSSGAEDFYNKAIRVKVKVIVKENGGKDKVTETVLINLVKESGKWKLYSFQ